MNGKAKAIYSLYRSCLREVRRLPTEYLRRFFRLKIGDDVRACLDPQLEHIHDTKLSRVQKNLRKLTGANEGHVGHLQYVLDTAYGRRGQLKWEIMEPLRTEPGAPLPPRIVRRVESSRPPVWSTELKALVTSDLARVRKALKPSALLVPSTIPPERLDSSSAEYRILGPFSKRREVNARWRFFNQELKKTNYPLQVAIVEPATSGDGVVHKFDKPSLTRAGIRSIGLQDSGVFEEVEALASPSLLQCSENQHASHLLPDAIPPRPRFESHLPRRFLQRRYQQLLCRIPVLTYSPLARQGDDVQAATRNIAVNTVGLRGRFRVSLSQHAAKQHGTIRAIAGSASMAWMRLAQERDCSESVRRG
ncbi:hypothetical protein L226DRAFT_23149 [Lentinus tigrinus ALCF2SS1-7]|uniref:LYR motif-containing protein Cup1-like N-terminal domain-containing protein n=1 Tax=Lentinus tigrinus ALCF2SS1-6 TaxID=1328759 RepID=A0A5C2S0Y3_9APHY|nr:hypothetical protein L227DRAFT_530743 [Lentinus tigrinus ALCF2SS1-6]RPD82338.1 hypothetical protein L226DRAFT_23149 [Lentinus tigrinus ALCF2SS1-7]